MLKNRSLICGIAVFTDVSGYTHLPSNSSYILAPHSQGFGKWSAVLNWAAVFCSWWRCSYCKLLGFSRPCQRCPGTTLPAWPKFVSFFYVGNFVIVSGINPWIILQCDRVICHPDTRVKQVGFTVSARQKLSVCGGAARLKTDKHTGCRALEPRPFCQCFQGRW